MSKPERERKDLTKEIKSIIITNLIIKDRLANMDLHDVIHVLLHALQECALMLPLLVGVYILIEFLESKKLTDFENSRLLKGNASPLFGALFGCVPQCGFSVISTDLYATKKLSVGALVAVYISTSDEALPIMFASITGGNLDGLFAMIMLIITKVVLAIGVGYLAMWVFPKVFKRGVVVNPRIKFGKGEVKTVVDPSAPSSGCCNHSVTAKKFSLIHPILHSLKIFAFVFAISFIMGLLVELIGEENLTAFLSSGYWFQPLIACAVGLIPNCASSVILTNLFLQGALSFGAIVTGLSVNAGLGMMILLRKNRPMKENFFIIGLVIVCALVAGYLLSFAQFMVV